MKKKLAIRGHSTRGKEVIELLEMLGGDNIYRHWKGRQENTLYFINEQGNIDNGRLMSNRINCEVFTLEEFLEKYPYKVGDKVTLYGIPCTITWMCWECNNVYYQVQGTDAMFQKKVEANQLKLYKETNMNENKFGTVNELPTFEPMFKMNDEIEYKIPDGYKISVVSKDWVSIKPIKPKYPKTYKECCDVLLIPPYYNLRYHTYERGYNEYATSNTLLSLQDKLNTLGKLIICRDAYWKIAGEEMGLGKPWDSTYGCGEWGYWIGYSINENKTYLQDCRILVNHTLVFPTEEMRDAFYENFKDLIESCKELL